MIRLVVGLGNPGREYQNTRHNVGFSFVEYLLDEFHSQRFDKAEIAGVFRKDFSSLYTKGRIFGEEIFFQLPQTYMNQSGLAVTQLMKYFKIDTSALLVVSDELDLEPGRMKLIKGGGEAGHNGLKSISQQLSSKDYWRLRIGIGRPRAAVSGSSNSVNDSNLAGNNSGSLAGAGVSSWVLGSLGSQDSEPIKAAFNVAVEAIYTGLSGHGSSGHWNRAQEMINAFRVQTTRT